VPSIGPTSAEALSRAEDPGRGGARNGEGLSRFESRVRWIAMLTLALLMAAHTLMETGRDALFLTHIPVEHLPWVYIVVAFSAVALSRVVGKSRAGSSARDRLLLLQALAATSVLGFWTALGETGPWLYYALYVWSGVISGIVVVTFWMLLGDVFTITQGKRVFASIAIGGSLGALAGSGLANVLAPTLGADSLLLASAAFFGASLLGPIWLGHGEGRSRSRASSMPLQPLAAVSFREGMNRTLGSPYACRIAILVALASATLTFSDYLFKSVLTEEVPVDQLSTWLARIYFGLNLASIAMLAVGVTPLVRRMGVDRSLAVLPALIGIATLGVFAGIAFVGVIVLKASDGMLRYSLHKTASELLFLPMESSLRAAVKGVIDLVGDSTAKAFASIAILGLVRLPEPRDSAESEATESHYPGARRPDRRRAVDSGGLRIAVYEWGPVDGPTLLMAHGGFDFAGTYDVFAPMLADRGFRVVCWDQRGHGDSEHAALYNWAADVRDARAVLDSTTDAPVHAAGHSKGGSVMMTLIEALPHRFVRFVNIDGIPWRNPAPDVADHERTRLLTAEVEGWLDRRARCGDAVRKPGTLDELAKRRRRMNPRLSLAWLRYIASIGARRDPDGWRWKIDPILRPGGFGPWRPMWDLERLPGLGVPLLAVLGMKPEPMGWGVRPKALEPYLPHGAQVVAYEDTGHFVHIEQPRRVADRVLDFFA